MNRKYAFSWDTVGASMEVARPTLGGGTTVEVYRLLQFTLRDAIEQRFGTEMADTLFREAGTLAGKKFFERYCAGAKNLNALVKAVQDRFRELGMGIFRVEQANPHTLEFMLTVEEDLDCSGLPDHGDEICVYDEGFIKGVLESFTGRNFDVREVDCWCTGARTCRFRAKATD